MRLAKLRSIDYSQQVSVNNQIFVCLIQLSSHHVGIILLNWGLILTDLSPLIPWYLTAFLGSGPMMYVSNSSMLCCCCCWAVRAPVSHGRSTDGTIMPIQR